MTAGTVKAGELRHRVAIETPVVGSQDAYGVPAITYSSASTWAAIDSLGASERKTAETWSPQITHVLTIRYTSGVDTRCRIVFGSRTFLINGVLPDPLNITQKLYCTELVGASA